MSSSLFMQASVNCIAKRGGVVQAKWNMKWKRKNNEENAKILKSCSWMQTLIFRMGRAHFVFRWHHPRGRFTSNRIANFIPNSIKNRRKLDKNTSFNGKPRERNSFLFSWDQCIHQKSEIKATCSKSTMSRLARPHWVDPTSNIIYDTNNADFEGWLTKQSMWLKVNGSRRCVWSLIFRGGTRFYVHSLPLFSFCPVPLSLTHTHCRILVQSIDRTGDAVTLY